MSLIRPIAETAESVTLRRADFERLIDLADALHARAVEKAVRRLARGESPMRLWRERRGISQRALAARAGMSVAYLSEIESRRKPGSVSALAALARALDVSMEDLLAAP